MTESDFAEGAHDASDDKKPTPGGTNERRENNLKSQTEELKMTVVKNIPPDLDVLWLFRRTHTHLGRKKQQRSHKPNKEKKKPLMSCNLNFISFGALRNAEGIQTASEHHVGNVAGRRSECCEADLEFGSFPAAVGGETSAVKEGRA